MQKLVDAFVAVGVLRSFGFLDDSEAKRLYADIAEKAVDADFYVPLTNPNVK